MIRTQVGKYPGDNENLQSIIIKDVKNWPGPSSSKECSSSSSSSSSFQILSPRPVTMTAASKGKRKPVNIKKSVCRKHYKSLKPRLKRLIEEGIILKETLRRKQDKLIEMSRDIHYILGRLLPYQKKLLPSSNKKEARENHNLNTIPLLPPPEQIDLKPQVAEIPSWDGFSSCSSNLPPFDTTSKNRFNFCLPLDVERQLASIVSEKLPLTLPDDIFSES